MKSILKTAVAAALSVTAISASAQAEDKFTWSFTAAGTSDIVFRGFTQTNQDPGLWGTVDVGYGIWYGGVYVGRAKYTGVKSVETDLYTGIRPVLGPVTFDLGFISYLYPGYTAVGVDYYEGKIGASGNLTKDLLVGATYYYTPDNQFRSGSTGTIEGTASYTLPQVWVFAPTLSGAVGYQQGYDEAAYIAANAAFGKTSYTYWNIGLALAVDKYTIDLRYWDTDIDNPVGMVNHEFDPSGRFVGTVKVTLP